MNLRDDRSFSSHFVPEFLKEMNTLKKERKNNDPDSLKKAGMAQTGTKSHAGNFPSASLDILTPALMFIHAWAKKDRTIKRNEPRAAELKKYTRIKESPGSSFSPGQFL